MFLISTLTILIFIIILMSINPVRECLIPYFVSLPVIYDLAFQGRIDFINQYIGDFLPPPPATILNFGCGVNFYSDYLVDAGYTVIPLDVTDTSVAKKVKPIVYDGVKIPPDLEFDCVIVTTVLHHIPEDICIDILQQFKSLNKQIIVMEDNNGSLLTPFWCMLTNLQFLNHPLNFKSYNEWKTLLSKYFRVKNIKLDNKTCSFNLFPIKDNVYIK